MMLKKSLAPQPNKQRKAFSGKKGKSYTANFERNQFQMDIGDMIELRTKDTQPRYILSIIDIFSK